MYEEKDLKIIALLLSSKKVKFIKTRLEPPRTIYFSFKPYHGAVELASGFYSKTTPKVHAKDLLEALDTARSIIFREKDRSRNVGVRDERRIR
jgi:hypothetical protein